MLLVRQHARYQDSEIKAATRDSAILVSIITCAFAVLTSQNVCYEKRPLSQQWKVVFWQKGLLIFFTEDNVTGISCAFPTMTSQHVCCERGLPKLSQDTHTHTHTHRQSLLNCLSVWKLYTFLTWQLEGVESDDLYNFSKQAIWASRIDWPLSQRTFWFVIVGKAHVFLMSLYAMERTCN